MRKKVILKKKMIKKSKVLILLGPTASGKSSVAKQLVEKNNLLQIINCDSKQIYSEIPIVTAQPSVSEIDEYNYKLYGNVSVYQNYSVTNWTDDAVREIRKSINENKIPFLVGGTGFYIKGLIEGLSEIPSTTEDIKNKVRMMIESDGIQELYKILSSLDQRIVGKIQPSDSYRVTKAASVFFQTGRSIFDFYGEKSSKLNDCEFIVSVIIPEREEIYTNINSRFDKMIVDGVIEEVKRVQLLDENLPAYKAHGLPELLRYLGGRITLENAIEIAKQNTRNYAKRQITWFKHQLKDAKVFKEADFLSYVLENEIRLG